MQYKEAIVREIDLVGISIRTNNEKAQAENAIGKLWECFFANDIITNIEDKVSNDIYCIYTDYISDFTEDYTTFIGCAVSKIDNVSEGLSIAKIETGKYYEFISKGVLPDCVLSTWTHIWSNNYRRAYKADFDVYGVDAQDSQNAKVKTYLSIL